MSGPILREELLPPPPDRSQILRYARGEQTPALSALLDECLAEAEPVLRFRLCYREVPIAFSGGAVSFSGFGAEGSALADFLRGRTRAVLFVATVGPQIDRLILRASRLSPARALLFDAIGTERVEALCDAFTARYGDPHRRFSPGYGDLPLGFQRAMFALLDPARRIGVSLGENLLMSPSKSVSAIIGIQEDPA